MKLTHREAALAIKKISIVDPDFSSDLPRQIATFVELTCEREDGIQPVSFGMIAYHLELHPKDVEKAVNSSEMLVLIDKYLVLTRYRHEEMEKNRLKELG